MRTLETGAWESLPPEGTPEDFSELSGRIARKVVERQLTVPVILFLESVKPLSFLGNQMLIFLNPMVTIIIESRDYQKFVRMIEDRENVEKLICAIEEENAREAGVRAAEKSARPRKQGLFARLLHGRNRVGLKGDGVGRQGNNQDTGDRLR